jgi:uncharacterized membrane protein YgcG
MSGPTPNLGSPISEEDASIALKLVSAQTEANFVSSQWLTQSKKEKLQARLVVVNKADAESYLICLKRDVGMTGKSTLAISKTMPLSQLHELRQPDANSVRLIFQELAFHFLFADGPEGTAAMTTFVKAVCVETTRLQQSAAPGQHKFVASLLAGFVEASGDTGLAAPPHINLPAAFVHGATSEAAAAKRGSKSDDDFMTRERKKTSQRKASRKMSIDPEDGNLLMAGVNKLVTGAADGGGDGGSSSGGGSSSSSSGGGGGGGGDPQDGGERQLSFNSLASSMGSIPDANPAAAAAPAAAEPAPLKRKLSLAAQQMAENAAPPPAPDTLSTACGKCGEALSGAIISLSNGARLHKHCVKCVVCEQLLLGTGEAIEPIVRSLARSLAHALPHTTHITL